MVFNVTFNNIDTREWSVIINISQIITLLNWNINILIRNNCLILWNRICIILFWWLFDLFILSQKIWLLTIYTPYLYCFGSLFLFFVCRTISYVNYLRHCYLTFAQKSIRLNKKHQFKLILTGNLSVTIS